MDGKPNAPMTPREYVDLIAGPTLAELLARRDDRRLAYLAYLTVYHCIDADGLEAACNPSFADAFQRSELMTLNVADLRDDRKGCASRPIQGSSNGLPACSDMENKLPVV